MWGNYEHVGADERLATYCLGICMDVLRKCMEHIRIVSALAHTLMTDEK
jgi:hypothetical protein